LAIASILVIDDDSAVSATIKLLLDRAGHNVVVANDGRNGLKIFESSQFDLLIVDIFMPGMDGLETIRLVHRQRPELPILVISGHAFPTDSNPTPDFLHIATKLGAITSLRKPFKPAELLTAIAKCLETAPGRPVSPDAAPGKTPSDS
jgi:CheY-like chemotaxis protein